MIIMKTVAFVGGGPTMIYTLHALVGRAKQPVSVTIYEEQASLGRGTPYRPGWNDPAMLSNIASIEIPPIEQTLVDWLHEQPEPVLNALDVDRKAIGERTFYPRLVLGEYFHSQIDKLLVRAKAIGMDIRLRTRCRVIDVRNEDAGMVLTVRPMRGDTFTERFDHVVLATGHQWPASPEVRPGYFLSPWPASALADITPCEVGVRGTSLTAIDATVALAVTHGEFVEGGDGNLTYRPSDGTSALHMTMMSRKGLLPEADFYAPIPYQPLAICTDAAIDRLIDEADGDLLDRAFGLFKEELIKADPAYASKTNMSDVSLEEFCDRYFSDRAASDPFEWAAKNLEEAKRNYKNRITVPWRYAILRMHEVVERLVPHFEAQDYQRFSKYFKPVFVDDYATVPHKSIKRMLALHNAGKLDVIAIGDKYRIDSYRPEGGAMIQFDNHCLSFPVFIEAIGQKALPAKEFPFPSLIRQGIIHDFASPQSGPARGVAIDEVYHPISDKIPTDRLFCLGLPFILGRHPFHQGITSSHEIGLLVGKQLADAIIGEAVPSCSDESFEAQV
jgi:uncharacterized NAD(P)/FAD-binding protein YdhS